MDAKNAMHILQNLANNAACEELHHKKAHQHAFRLPCPVVEEIQQAAGAVSKRIAELEEENQRLRDAAQKLVDAISEYQYPSNKPAIPLPGIAGAANELEALLGGENG